MHTGRAQVGFKASRDARPAERRLDAPEDGCSLGEACGVTRDVSGECQPDM
jgi:hypothetical protein